MKKKKRICKAGLTYCIRSRCINLEPRMNHPRMKKLMLDIISWALDKYAFELNGFDIQDCDFIFLIKPLSDEESISRIMQFVKSQFARRYNVLHNRKGPFWNERFYDEIVEYSSNPEEFLFFLTREINKKTSDYSSKTIKEVKEVYIPGKKLILETIMGIKVTVSSYFFKEVKTIGQIEVNLQKLGFEFTFVQ